MSSVVEKFLRYVSYDTQSDSNEKGCPSTKRQFELGKLLVEELKGGLPAKMLASVLLIFSPFSRLNILFHPNAFDILVWTIIFYMLVKFITSQNNKWLLM